MKEGNHFHQPLGNEGNALQDSYTKVFVEQKHILHSPLL